jgi:hypothetical protein
MGESPPPPASPMPPPQPEDKDSASSPSSKAKHKRKLIQTVVIGITIIIALIFLTNLAFTMFDINYKTTTTIVDGVIDTRANYYTYYTFSVPAGASNARITGNY